MRWTKSSEKQESLKLLKNEYVCGRAAHDVKMTVAIEITQIQRRAFTREGFEDTRVGFALKGIMKELSICDNSDHCCGWIVIAH